jgi:hypothetical protein
MYKITVFNSKYKLEYNDNLLIAFTNNLEEQICITFLLPEIVDAKELESL